MKIITKNRRAFYDYSIGERFEAGLVLKGHEVKSIKTGHILLKGSFVVVRDGEAYLLNAQIPAYPYGTPEGYDPTRTRKLLLHKKELLELDRVKDGKSNALVPLAVGIKNGRVKLEIGIGTGKKEYDKRETIKQRQAKREIDSRVKLTGR